MNLVSVYDDMKADLIASSVSPEGVRLDTFKLRYARYIHAEVMTHRVFSRNASSSRAIPVTKLAEQPILVPDFKHNQPGMQPGQRVDADSQLVAESIWAQAAATCLEAAAELADKNGLNIHKQWPNRMLEWFGAIEVVVSSTDWENFFALRDHPDAQDEIRHLAGLMKAERDRIEPIKLGYDDWHLPFIRPEDEELVSDFVLAVGNELNAEAAWGQDTPNGDLYDQAMFAFKDLPNLTPEAEVRLVMSAARCARASYKNFRGDTAVDQDFSTFLKLAGSEPVHASPLEHQARPARKDAGRHRCGNFYGWQQFRKFVPGEAQFDR